MCHVCISHARLTPTNNVLQLATHWLINRSLPVSLTIKKLRIRSRFPRHPRIAFHNRFSAFIQLIKCPTTAIPPKSFYGHGTAWKVNRFLWLRWLLWLLNWREPPGGFKRQLIRIWWQNHWKINLSFVQRITKNSSSSTPLLFFFSGASKSTNRNSWQAPNSRTFHILCSFPPAIHFHQSP